MPRGVAGILTPSLPVIFAHAAMAFFPRLRACLGRGTRSPGHTRSSNSRDSLANPSRIAGVLLSLAHEDEVMHCPEDGQVLGQHRWVLGGKSVPDLVVGAGGAHRPLQRAGEAAGVSRD